MFQFCIYQETSINIFYDFFFCQSLTVLQESPEHQKKEVFDYCICGLYVSERTILVWNKEANSLLLCRFQILFDLDKC